MQGCFDCGWVSVSGCWCVAKVPTLQNVLALASFDFIVVSRTHANMDQTSKKKKKFFFLVQFFSTLVGMTHPEMNAQLNAT